MYVLRDSNNRQLSILSSQGYGFSSGHVWMWELDCEESWEVDAFELWCWRRLFRVPWTARRCNQFILKMNWFLGWSSLGWTGFRDQSWVFIGRIDVEAESPVLWPPHVKSWLIGKDPHTGRDWGQEEKGMTEDEIAGWHHRLDGYVWVNSGNWWWAGRTGVLQFMGLQRVRHNWVNELNWTD